MTTRPHDLSDLYLSPIALALDRRLDELVGLTEEEIEFHVALETDRQPRDRAERSPLLLLSLTHGLETHGWELSWVPRGLRISHAEHALVLGVPDSAKRYLVV